jgi:undecaprenyl-diphosphatase
MTVEQAIILGITQGVSELFPVSSLAQTILIPALFGWDLNAQRKDYLAMVVALHLATAAALVIYFWDDWRRVLAAYLGSLRHRRLVYDRESRFAWLLVAGTIVVGLAGLLFDKRISALFEKPEYTWIVAVLLIINGFVMILADALKRRLSRRGRAPESSDAAGSGSGSQVDLTGGVVAGGRKMAEDLSFPAATVVGATQSLALLPGISRSGVAIVGGLLAGLDYEQASRFAFMLATPVIVLAGIKKLPQLFAPEARQTLYLTAVGAIVAGVCAYLSIRFLMRYFRHNRLAPFGYFCIAFGAFCLVVFRMRG